MRTASKPYSKAIPGSRRRTFSPASSSPGESWRMSGSRLCSPTPPLEAPSRHRVWGKALPDLLAGGHDVIWAGVWAEDPGDREILLRAQQDRRVLVTLDKDFGTLAVLSGQTHSGILRLVGISARRQASIVGQVLDRYSEELLSGAIV